MKSAITRVILAALSVFSVVNLSHAGVYTVYPGFSKDIALEPSQSHSLSNPFFWSLTINCQVTSTEVPMLIKAKLTKKSAEVDGISISEGQSVEVPLRYNQQIHIKASSRASVNITNVSSQFVSASCSV